MSKGEGERPGAGSGPEPRMWACGGLCTVSTEILDHFVFRAGVRWVSFYSEKNLERAEITSWSERESHVHHVGAHVRMKGIERSGANSAAESALPLTQEAGQAARERPEELPLAPQALVVDRLHLFDVALAGSVRESVKLSVKLSGIGRTVLAESTTTSTLSRATRR